MTEAQLKAEEFAFLLTIVKADSIPGLEAPRRPSDATEDARYLERGRAGLEQKGWITFSRQGLARFDDELVLSVAVIAAAERSVVSSRVVGDRRAQFGHFFAQDQVVELVLKRDGTFLITRIADNRTALTRLVRTFRVFPEGRATIARRVSTDDFAALKRRLQTRGAGNGGLAASLGLSPDEADSLEETLASPTVTGDVTLTRWWNLEPARRQAVDIFVGQHATWLAWQSPDAPEYVDLQSASEATFISELERAMEKLKR